MRVASKKPGFADRYASGLRRYVGERSEDALLEASKLGRSALAEGMEVQAMVDLHHAALVSIIEGVLALSDRPLFIQAAGKFLAECLAPFEMNLRGYRETNVILQVSDNRYRELFENANDVVFTMDLAGNFTSLNKAGEYVSGYSRKQVAHMNFGRMIAPEQRGLVCEMLGDGATRYEVEIITKDEKRVPLEISTGPIYEGGRLIGVQGIARDIRERKRREQALLRLNEGFEEQAQRVAHALHDEAAQLLASVHLALDVATRRLAPLEKAAIENVKELLDQTEVQLRHLSHELRPTILDNLGLYPALEFLAHRVAKLMHIPVIVEGGFGGRLPAQAEIVVYRVAQEALNNVIQHSKAKGVKVHLWREGNVALCSIRDDGIGFDLKALAREKGRRGLGLIGMQERLVAVYGCCIIKSSPGRGTEILAKVPVEPQGAAPNPSC